MRWFAFDRLFGVRVWEAEAASWMAFEYVWVKMGKWDMENKLYKRKKNVRWRPFEFEIYYVDFYGSLSDEMNFLRGTILGKFY